LKAILISGVLLAPFPQFAAAAAVSMIEAASFASAQGGLLREGTSMRGATGSLLRQGRPMFEAREVGNGVEVLTKAPSLFVGQAGQSFFAPYPVRPSVHGMPGAMSNVLPSGLQGVEIIRQIIGEAESRHKGYDAVQHGARIKPTKEPTDMTLGEIFAWIKATPGQPHAIGRYQFIPRTLRWLVERLEVQESARFTPELQDRLADLLLEDAGIHGFRSGELKRHDFMNNLAKIWAGLPTSDGVSYYEGYAGNSASMSWADFDAQMSVVFAANR
jgi:muramidase (phage lysozyme)